jgi:N-acylneuraminate cytidylyltransferase/CMP-N,N'-diacetyllegionaminic acid synthase
MRVFKGKKIIGIIPARGGSKGLPRKNILPLLGKPLIAWTIEHADSSKYLDRVIVSTDDSEIAEISKQYGVNAPFIRPSKLASDESKGIDVVLHAIEWLKNNKEACEIILLLQPTSPNRSYKDIDNSIELLFQENARAIVSVCEVEHPPYWANTLPQNHCMKNFISVEIKNKNRQELPTFYRLNGAIYLAYCNYLKTQNSFFGNDTYAYVMPRERSVDIDTENDFVLAEHLMQRAK